MALPSVWQASLSLAAFLSTTLKCSHAALIAVGRGVLEDALVGWDPSGRRLRLQSLSLAKPSGCAAVSAISQETVAFKAAHRMPSFGGASDLPRGVTRASAVSLLAVPVLHQGVDAASAESLGVLQARCVTAQ